METIILFFIGILFVLVNGSTDPCHTTKILNDWWRSVARTSSSEGACDNYLDDGWYQIVSGAGAKMPTECPQGRYSCGTSAPIWLSNDTVLEGEDIYPEVGETVKRVAYRAYEPNCKTKAFNISIKNCGSYFVYYLVSTGGCPGAYCFGDQLPCPTGESSETGFTPGCGPFPNVEISPYITTQLEETTENIKGIPYIFSNVTFQCHAHNLLEDYLYEIRWYIGNFEISTAKSNNLTKTEVANGGGKMLEEHWTSLFRPNFILKCSIKVRGIGYKAPGPEQFSQPFFAGIRIDKTDYIINENEALSIPIELTIPLSCFWRKGLDASVIEDIKQNDCLLNVLNGVPTYQKDESYCKNGVSNEGLIFQSEQCGIVFTHANWKETQYIRVTGASDGQINIADNIVYLRLFNDPEHVRPYLDSLKVWTGIHLTDIKVTIRDTDKAVLSAECISQNDPHFKTFGQRKYELQYRDGLTEGEYIMYTHSSLPLQVNAFFKRCKSGSNALCNCGVAVRSGDSLFVTNFCETELQNGERRTNNYIIQRLCDDQNLIVEENGNKYEIMLPSGTKVKFSHTTLNGKHTIDNIIIQPSSIDIGKINGLCSTFTGKNHQSLVPRGEFASTDPNIFAKSWKVADEIKDLTLFDPKGTLKQLEHSIQEYCTCKMLDTSYPHTNSDFSCNLSAAMKTCRRSKTLKSVYTATCATRVHFSKRSASRGIVEKTTDADKDDAPHIYPMTSESTVDESNQTSPEWSNGWTYDTARAFCTTSIYNAPAFGPCSKYVPYMDPEAYIENCILDIKYDGNSTWIKSTLEGFADVCLEKAHKLENLTKTNDTTSSGAEKSVFDIISESTCAENCSGHGKCENSVCNCTVGYYGSSCSSDAPPPPLIIRNAFEGECNTHERPCNKFRIPGSNFIDDSNLTCKFEHFKIIKNITTSIVVTEEIFEYPGIFRGSFFMNCELPEMRRKRSIDDQKFVEGYDISVSNNGQVFTEPLKIIIFDSLCFKCNFTVLLCDELDTCPRKLKEPTTSNDIKSKNLAIYIGVPIAVVFFIVVSVCLRKKLRPRQQQPYVDNYFTPLQNRGNGPGNTHFQAEPDYL